MSMLLAKSTGELLLDHLSKVGCKAREFAESISKLNKQGTALAGICYAAGLSHDIGKAIPAIQEYLSGKKQFPGCYHNEYSAFMVRMYGKQMFAEQIAEAIKAFPGTSANDWVQLIETSVYWHHPKDKSRNGQYDVLGITDADVSAMASAWTELTGQELTLTDIPYEQNTPTYVMGGIDCKATALMNKAYRLNPVLMIVNACLIRADRSVSGAITETYAEYAPITDIAIPDCYKNNRIRFNEQNEIVAGALNSPTNTCVVNAPAGHGKTLEGLRYILAVGGHAIWVLPRNAPLESTYDGIVRELTACGIKGVSVEKVYAHKRQGAFVLGGTVGDDEPCRITVTNLDAVVEPFGNDNGLRITQYDTLKYTIVFDEYHESVSSEPMYYAFHTLLACRATYCTARQLLISATAIPIMLGDDRVTYLPGKWKSYHAQHQDTYHFGQDGTQLASGGVTMSLTVANAQAIQSSDGAVLYVHSKFTDDDRKAIFGKLYAGYGKNATGYRSPVSSGPILQASLDISFDTMDMSLCSPQMAIQCLGRCNRFGDGKSHHVNFRQDTDQGSAQYRTAQYDVNLYKSWADYVHDNITGKTLCLDELYTMYGKYMEANAGKIESWQKAKLCESTAKLNLLLYPIRFDDTGTTKSKDNSCGNVTMRSSSPGIFYVVKRNDGTGYAGPFSASVDDLNRPGSLLMFTPDGDYRKMLMHIDQYVGDQFPELKKRLVSECASKRKRYAEYYMQSMHGKNPGQAYRFAETPLVIPDTVAQYDTVLGITKIAHRDDE